MTFQIAPGAPGRAHPTRFAEDVAVQCVVDEEGQRRADYVRRILLVAVLLHLSRGNLLQLRHRHRAVAAFLRGGDVFDVVVGQHRRTVGVAVDHRQVAAAAHHFRLGFEHRIAVVVFNLGDEVRVNQVTAVRQHRVAAHQLHRGEGGRTQRQRFGMHDVLRREAEALQIFRRVVDAHRTHCAHHHHVLRLPQPLAQANRAVVGRRRVLRPPVGAGTGIPTGNRQVVQNGSQRQAFIHRGGVQERFDVRPHLAQSLGDAVELALVEVEAADQRFHRAVVRIDRDQRRIDVRDLRQPPGLVHFTHPHLLAGLHHVGDAFRRWALLRV